MTRTPFRTKQGGVLRAGIGLEGGDLGPPEELLGVGAGQSRIEKRSSSSIHWWPVFPFRISPVCTWGRSIKDRVRGRRESRRSFAGSFSVVHQLGETATAVPRRLALEERIDICLASRHGMGIRTD